MALTLETHNKGCHSVVVTTAGTGYVNGSAVTFSTPASGAGKRPATGYIETNPTTGAILAVHINDPGFAYANDADCTITAIGGDAGADAVLTPRTGIIQTAKSADLHVSVVQGVWTGTGANSTLGWWLWVRDSDWNILRYDRLGLGISQGLDAGFLAHGRQTNAQTAWAVSSGLFQVEATPTISGNTFSFTCAHNTAGSKVQQFLFDFYIPDSGKWLYFTETLKNITDVAGTPKTFPGFSRIGMPSALVSPGYYTRRYHTNTRDWAAVGSTSGAPVQSHLMLLEVAGNSAVSYLGEGALDYDAATIQFGGSVTPTVASGTQCRWLHGTGELAPQATVVLPRFAWSFGDTIEAAAAGIVSAARDAGTLVEPNTPARALELKQSTWIEDTWTPTIAKIDTDLATTKAAGVNPRWIAIDEGWRGAKTATGRGEAGDWTYHNAFLGLAEGATQAEMLSTFRAAIDRWHASGSLVQLYLTLCVSSDSALFADYDGDYLRNPATLAPQHFSIPADDTAGRYYYVPDKTYASGPGAPGDLYRLTLARITQLVQELDVDEVKLDFTATLATLLSNPDPGSGRWSPYGTYVSGNRVWSPVDGQIYAASGSVSPLTEWSVETAYGAGAFCVYEGVVYVTAAGKTGGDPPPDNETDWAVSTAKDPSVLSGSWALYSSPNYWISGMDWSEAREPGTIYIEYVNDFIAAIKAGKASCLVQSTNMSLFEHCDSVRTNDLYNKTRGVDLERQHMRNTMLAAFAATRAVSGDFINGGGGLTLTDSTSAYASTIWQDARLFGAWIRRNQADGVQLELGVNPFKADAGVYRFSARERARLARLLRSQT